MHRATIIAPLGLVETAPQEYRYALDGALAACGGQTPFVISHLPELIGEIRWRVPQPLPIGEARVILWVEPLVGVWRAELQQIIAGMPSGGVLTVIASRPLAKQLPERRGWEQRALGLRVGGIRQLARALVSEGMMIEAEYGIHTTFGVGFNVLAEHADRRGSPERADQLRFAARLWYCRKGIDRWLSTVALFVARKQGDR